MIDITYSATRAFLDCPQKYDWRYRQCLAPKEIPVALTFGGLIHASLELWHKGNAEQALAIIDIETDLAPQDKAKAMGIMRAYIDRYPTEPFEVKALEMEFKQPIINPATKHSSRTYTMRGKVDGIVYMDGEYYLLEHKTTSSIDEAYLMRLSKDRQIILYQIYMERQLGKTFAGVIYNILEKPRIRQKQKETDEEFAERCYEESSKPEAMHREIMRFNAYKKRMAEDHHWHLLKVMMLMENGSMPYYQNDGNCTQWGRPCPYLPLCQFKTSHVPNSQSKQELLRLQEALYDKRIPHAELQEVTDD